MFGQQFYHQTIRKYVALFGTLFNDIHIARTNKQNQITQYIKVPITYAPKEKMLARLQQDPNIDRPSATITMPIMSFEMTGISYDGSRKLNTINKTVVTDTVNGSSKQTYQYSPVPYNLSFRLYIMVKNAEDGTKIVEQILPYFTPDFTTTVMLIPDMNEKKDIPVILNTISQEDSYEGNFTERQSLTWTIDFTMKGYIYGPVKKAAIIKYANTVFYTPSVADGELETTVGITPAVAYVQIQPGLNANGQPTSNVAQSIAVNEIVATDDYGYVTTITENE